MNIIFSKYPLLSRAVCFVAIPIFVAVVVASSILEKSLPVIEGSIHSYHISNELTISRDKYSVPHIDSENKLDGYFALGFVHAQDRLWQMEMARRTAHGTLSEVLGIESLDSDIISRTMNLSGNAKDSWENLSESNRVILKKYTEGLNFGIGQLGVLPLEFLLLNYEPVEWMPIDSLAILQLMGLQLSNSLNNELMRTSLLQEYGVDATDALISTYPFVDSENENIELVGSSESIRRVIANRPYRPFIGSNAWVISKGLTSNGKSHLANDPHLTHTTPSFFYLAQLDFEGYSFRGATIPGLPFFALGTNGYITWGATTLMADDMDLFKETIHPHNKKMYLHDNAYQHMSARHESINIRNKLFQRKPEPFELEVLETGNGPIIFSETNAQMNTAYSLAWTGKYDSGRNFNSFLELNFSKDWNEFKASLSEFVGPAHNFLYTDGENIGSIAAGYFPIRPLGHGALPANGNNSTNSWKGRLPAEVWPQQYNPEQGYIISANHNILNEDYPHYISDRFSPDYRHDRIEQLLTKQIENGKKISPQDSLAYQLDTFNPLSTLFESSFNQLPEDKVIYREAVKILQSWDGDMSKDSVGATIFSHWLNEFTSLAIKDETFSTSKASPAKNTIQSILEHENYDIAYNLISNNGIFCQSQYTDSDIQSCEELVVSSFRNAIDRLKSKYGDISDRWQWGKTITASHPHFPFSKDEDSQALPGKREWVWSGLFSLKNRSQGSSETVNVAPPSQADISKYRQFYGAIFRQFHDGDNYLYRISTGQSGNILSDHYRNQLKIDTPFNSSSKNYHLLTIKPNYDY